MDLGHLLRVTIWIWYREVKMNMEVTRFSHLKLPVVFLWPQVMRAKLLPRLSFSLPGDHPGLSAASSTIEHCFPYPEPFNLANLVF